MVVNSSRPGCMDDLSIALVTFEGAEEQDVVGPYEMFWWMYLFQGLPPDRPITESDFADTFYPKDGSTPPNVFTVAPTTDPYRMSSGMRFIPDFSYDNAAAANMIVAPGGRGARDIPALQKNGTIGAIDRILRLKEFDLTWVEEPVAADDVHGHRAVREAVRPVPIQTGENWWFPRGMANAVAAKDSDLAMIDIMKIGGVTGWISAAGQAEAASLRLSSHAFIEASAHTMASSPTASWFEYLDLAGAVLTEPLVPNNGKVVPRGPGLGIEWDEKAVHKYAFE